MSPRTPRERRALDRLADAAARFIGAETLDSIGDGSPVFVAAVAVVNAWRKERDGTPIATLRDGTRLECVLSRRQLRDMAKRSVGGAEAQ